MESITTDELYCLQQTLNSAIDAIRNEISLHGLPNLSTLSNDRHPMDDPTFIPSPRLFEARKLALGKESSLCCTFMVFHLLLDLNSLYFQGQIRNILQQPYERVVEQSFAPYDTACLDIAVKTGIIDILVEPSEGVTVTEIGRKLLLDVNKLRMILRYLATQGWFMEVSEDTFTLTRAALELAQGTNGRNWVLTPGKLKVASSLLDTMTHPEWKFSTSATETAFQLSHDTDLSLFEWLKERPEELLQWSKSVKSLGSVYEHALALDYPWECLSPGSFLDCGGGQGYLTIMLLSECTFVIQDLPEVIHLAQSNIATEIPDALTSGAIIAEAHNFFQVQPRTADNYMFRYILHDWSDADCITILQNTAKNAHSKSRFLIIEHIVVPTAPSMHHEGTNLDDLQGTSKYQAITPPPYIPLNFGVSAKMHSALGVHMMGVFNACERSLSQWEIIFNKAGLHITNIKNLRANVSVIECRLSSKANIANAM
ncbi:S-adenosyl-L-methionine-dependent methyltransferase [Mycena floridula]|nr:S-adenosyl-L-methionine-dependent methyltransferase [Mycena floridula]